MTAELRWMALVIWLIVSFFFQMPVLASGLDAELGGYVVAASETYGAFYDKDGKESTTRHVLRKAKLGLEVSYNEDWHLEIDADLQDDGEEWTREFDDVWIEYRGLDWGRVRVGQMKEPFGLERLGSYSALMSNERSVATNAFAPGRSQGVLVSVAGEDTTLAVGAFRADNEPGSPRAVSVRGTLAPLVSDREVFHLGAAVSLRDLRGERFQIKDEGEVFTADNVIRSPRFDAEEAWLVGGEMAYSRGALTLVAEAFGQQVQQVNGDLWRFYGGYVQAGWLISGEHRGYDKGEFDRVKPTRRLGAVELVARWSGVDLRDRGVGAEAAIKTLGINYYWKKTLLLRVNYLWPSIEGNALMANPDGGALTGRLQVRF